MAEKPNKVVILKMVDAAFDRQPVDTIRRGLRAAFRTACQAGDASAATIAKTLLELETSRHESNEAQAPIEKKGAKFCPSCGQRLAMPDAQSAINFRLCFGGESNGEEAAAAGQADERV